MTLPPFDFHAPATLPEAFALLAQHGTEAKLMAGGTDLLLQLESGKVQATHVVSLRKVEALQGLQYDDRAGLTIKAGTVVADVARYEPVQKHYPLLARAAGGLATVQVRNKATVAGNLCNASPCADTATPLMALGATVFIAGPQGRRGVALEDFITGPKETLLQGSELLESIQVPPPAPGMRATFRKHSSRSSADVAAVSLSVALRMQGDVMKEVSIFLGSVAPTPMRAVAAQGVLQGQPVTAGLLDQAAAAARGECRPITDVRATKEYRAHMVEVLTRRALATLTGQP